jgi:hypothetical protein
MCVASVTSTTRWNLTSGRSVGCICIFAINAAAIGLVRSTKLCHQVDFVAIPFGNIREHLFVQKLDGIPLDMLYEVGKEQFEKFDEKRHQQFLKQPVVIHCATPHVGNQGNAEN